MQRNISLSATRIAHNLPDFYNHFLYIWKKSRLKALLTAAWKIYGAFTNDLGIARLKSPAESRSKVGIKSHHFDKSLI